LEVSGTSIRPTGSVAATRPRDVELIAAVAALLGRHTDRSELLLGYRPGNGSPPLRLRLDLSGDPSFSELRGRIDELVDLVGAGPPADGGSEADLDALVVNDVNDPDGGRWLVQRGGALIEPAPFDPLRGHLARLLQDALAEPDRPIAALNLLSDAERRQLLVEWNATRAPYPDRCVHELFAEQARRTPDAVAVQFEAEQLTYAELNARANRLARHLVSLGVGAEALVGICVERSIEMVLGLLGIMKAGGAYVPIDPAYPAERQEFMLTSSQAPVIVTQERLRAGLPPTDATVVCLDRDWPAIEALAPDAPEGSADPRQLAYVIYTSGSTGQPKGVQISHRALVNFLVTMGQRPGLGADDVLVAVTTLSFDIAGLELYLPLITGARVVVAGAATSTDPRGLAALLDRAGATIMQATPTTWRMLIDSGWPGKPGLKALCGGEALPLALAERLVAAGLELWNMYGPTETTIWSTCSRIETQGEPLTIGRPIANTTLYILDARLQPVPVGVAGELWIGGDGLARGYRGRDDLTAERFVAHPFAIEVSSASGGAFDTGDDARIYRTGDLARYRPDGSVDFLGRIDHQVKVRGFRIELGEIETVLTRHPGISDAVVVALGTGAEAELAAYVIARQDPVPALQCREFLSQTLPAYMVPSSVTTLAAFPLTPNGKVDRKALPAPTRERSEQRRLIAASTPLQRRLVAVWERELEIHPIGITDNFFDLGVTSIVAARLFAAIERELGDRLPLGAIFRAPTIEALAALIEAGESASRWTSLVPIQPEGSQPPIFCVHGGAGTILHLEPLARRLGPDQPFYGLQSSGLYGGSLPLSTVPEMASHYLSEMRQVHPGGSWCLAGYCFGALVAFEMAQRLRAEGETVRLVAIFNGPSPSWLRTFGSFQNQPSRLALRPRPPRITPAQRVRRAVREPRRLRTALVWYWERALRERRTERALARGRSLPERVREQYFLNLHFRAERAYEPAPYDGDLLVFYGDGLYEDPELGWGGLAKGGIATCAVPGENTNNRDAMAEPNVAFVSRRLREYLEQTPELAK
jgi:amino acid adenylation domain-containing protein